MQNVTKENQSSVFKDLDRKKYDPRLNRTLIHYRQLHKTYQFLVDKQTTLFGSDEEFYDKLISNLLVEIRMTEVEIKDFING